MTLRSWLGFAIAAAIAVAAWFWWQSLQPDDLPPDFAKSNGRVEAVEIDVATKSPGRVIEILADEGDFVAANEVLARMDTNVLEAQLREAEAQFHQAKSAVDSARSSVTQRESEKSAAESRVAQREAEREVASRRLKRSENLAKRDALAEEQLDDHRAAFYSAEAALNAAKADVAASDAAIATTRSQVIGAEASVAAARATIDRLRSEIDDCVLRSPRDGRVQYRVAQPGEVLSAGGNVLNLVDLADVYMTFFLPTAQAGRIRIGTEARVVLDAAPHYVLPARVTFVADVAQFTPKTVETAEERQKLMFRVKAHFNPELLKRHIRSVKTGLPGMAYVQLDPGAQWPPGLEVRLPDDGTSPQPAE